MVLAQDTNVRFVELPGTDLHRYILTHEDGTSEELIGVTSLMKRQGLSKSYANVNPDILARAAARGTAIHEMFQAYEVGEPVLGNIRYCWSSAGQPMEETEDCSALLKAYIKLSKQNFKSVAVEYLVSDDECVASMVDMVSQVDEDYVDLIDYKSSSTLDKKGLQWQLSFYKYLFERQNPFVRVRDLIGVHCNNARSFKMVSVPYLGDSVIEETLEAYKNGEEQEGITENGNLPSSFGLNELVPDCPQLEMLLALRQSLQDKLKKVEDELEEPLDELKAVMEEKHIADIAVPGGKYVFTAAHSVTRFDSKAFKAAKPKDYEKWSITGTVAASLKFYKDR